MLKRLAELKTGDIIVFDQSTFLCREDSQHWVESGGDVYSCRATCLTGSSGQYYYPGSDWNFQGRDDRMFEAFEAALDVDQPKPASLNKSDIQYLLSELRETLAVVSELKNEFKGEAEDLWNFCDKDDPSTRQVFAEFSEAHRRYLHNKKNEPKLAALIKKVKSLR